jgi:hypothetical protein
LCIRAGEFASSIEGVDALLEAEDIFGEFGDDCGGDALCG